MPSSPLDPDSESHSPGGEASLRGMSEKEAKAVETFSVEVTAGGRSKLGRASRTVTPRMRSLPVVEATRFEAQADSKHVEQLPKQRRIDSPAAPKIALGRKPSSKQFLRGYPSSTISLVVHVCLFVALSIYTLSLPAVEEEVGLYASATSYEEVEEFQDLEIDPSEDFDSLETELSPELSDPDMATFSDLSAETALADMAGGLALDSEDIIEVDSLLGDVDGGLSDLSEELSTAATASFFGTQVEGRRIVYVLDNSGGMRQGELETLVDELLKSIDSLTPKQDFYIIFYSDVLYPLFYPNAPQNFVRATDKNKQFVRDWLETVEFCLGNVVDEAVGAALSIRPDVIYLLTDGNLDQTRDLRRMQFLLHGTGGAVPIHTFGMGTGETGKRAEKLKQVAEANNGTFKAVKIATAAKARAKKRDRPYRKKESPGLIWGRYAD